MKCLICKQSLRGKPDLERHAEVAHKLNPQQYHEVVASIRRSIRGLNAFEQALKATIGLLLLAFMTSGCTQWKKLTGAETKDMDCVADIGGVWVGRLNLNGVSTPANFILIQHDNQITSGNRDGSFFSIDYSGYGYTYLNGTVSGNTFTITGHDGTRCANPWTFSGEVTGGTMLVRIQTQGNNVAGTSCYPSPIDQTISMTH